MFLRPASLAVCVAISLAWLGGTRAFAEEAPASGKAAAKEPSAKEKPHANETAEKPKASANKASADKETGTKPSSAQSGQHHTHDIDTRLPGPPAHRTGPGISPIVIVPHPALPSSHFPQVGVRPVTPALPSVHPQGVDAARSAFGAVTRQSPVIKQAAPVIAVAPAPNHAVINGTTMTRHATGPATIGGPAKNPGMINGTTIRRKP